MVRTLIAAAFAASPALGDLVGISTVPLTASGGLVEVDATANIIVDPHSANSTDTQGWTLVPPTLSKFAETFSSDLSEVFGPISQGTTTNGTPIYLTLDDCWEFRDATGCWNSEAYSLSVSQDTITITGSSPLGVWWGTRTVLQQAVLRIGSLATGYGVDSAGWNTRGILVSSISNSVLEVWLMKEQLDAGRRYYPPDFLVEMCHWISFWKQNTLHVHLCDNLYNNVDIYGRPRQLELYASFRLFSNDSVVAGLDKYATGSYTRSDLDYIQSACAARGVTIISEIEAPGHALVILQWKPELGLNEQLDLLNISNPDSCHGSTARQSILVRTSTSRISCQAMSLVSCTTNSSTLSIATSPPSPTRVSAFGVFTHLKLTTRKISVRTLPFNTGSSSRTTRCSTISTRATVSSTATITSISPITTQRATLNISTQRSSSMETLLAAPLLRTSLITTMLPKTHPATAHMSLDILLRSGTTMVRIPLRIWRLTTPGAAISPHWPISNGAAKPPKRSTTPSPRRCRHSHQPRTSTGQLEARHPRSLTTISPNLPSLSYAR